ncbi:MAG: hypothetical protein KTR25_15295 [Myxococcales bacterium]|nr:hypothetical protein [Myxococcales bacterium]
MRLIIVTLLKQPFARLSPDFTSYAPLGLAAHPLSVLLVIGLSGCGDSLINFNNEVVPVFRLKGKATNLATEITITTTYADIARYDVQPTDAALDIYRRQDASRRQDADLMTMPLHQLRLRVGVMWLRSQGGIPACLDFGPRRDLPSRSVPDIFRTSCRDPFDAVPDAVTHSVALSPDRDEAEFEIEFFDSPDRFDSQVLSGPAAASVGVASIILFIDGDNDGVFSSQEPASALFTPDDATPFDIVVGATMMNIDSPHVRLTFLGKKADPGGYSYPAPQCRSLVEPGYAVWRVSGTTDPSPSCEKISPTSLELSAQSSKIFQLECETQELWSLPLPPDQDLLALLSTSPRFHYYCLNREELFITIDRPCQMPTIMSLVGCFGSHSCEEDQQPTWDLRINPPSQWPCGDDE